MTVIIAHWSWPCQDAALPVCLYKQRLHRPVGLEPQYSPPELVTRANGQLKLQAGSMI